MSTTPGNEAKSYSLTCRMHQEHAALERLCQVIRIRGFTISDMQVRGAEGKLNIEVTVRGHRPVAMLCAQLEKLHTIDHAAETVPTGPALRNQVCVG